MCGDFNSRTGTGDDYVQNDSRDDFIHLPHCYTPDNTDIPPRSILDLTRNNYGKKLIELCIGRELLIINGRTNGDLFGNFTCFKYNGCSTVDYNIISKECLAHVKSFKTLPFHEYSDHRPIALTLEIQELDVTPTTDPLITLSDAPGKFIFDENSKFKYRNTLLSQEYQTKITNFHNKFYHDNEFDVDNDVSDFTHSI